MSEHEKKHANVTKQTHAPSKTTKHHDTEEPSGFRLLTVRNVVIAFAICLAGFLYFGFKDAGTASTSGIFGYGGKTYECGSILNSKSYKGTVLGFSGGADQVNSQCSKQRNESLALVIIFGLVGLGLGWLIRGLWEEGGSEQFIARLKDGK